MSVGLRLLIDEISKNDAHRPVLVARVLTLIAEMPDGPAKADQLLDLVEVLRFYDRREALRQAHAAYLCVPDNPRAMVLMAEILEADGKIQQAELIRVEMARRASRPPEVIVEVPVAPTAPPDLFRTSVSRPAETTHAPAPPIPVAPTVVTGFDAPPVAAKSEDSALAWARRLDALIDKGDPLAAWWDIREHITDDATLDVARIALDRLPRLREALRDTPWEPPAVEWRDNEGMAVLRERLYRRPPYERALRVISVGTDAVG